MLLFLHLPIMNVFIFALDEKVKQEIFKAYITAAYHEKVVPFSSDDL